jgi:hypothetical protein
MFQLFKKKKETISNPPQKTRSVAMSQVYIDKFGNRWFEYSNPLDLPAKRAISAEVATRFADLNLTRSVFLFLVGEMKKAANKGDIVELFRILGEMEFRTGFLGEEETLIELALCYYVLEDEDETSIDSLSRQKKIDIFKTDEDARAFFLRGAFSHTIKYSDMSEEDILEYLKMNVPEKERLDRLTRGTISPII